MMISDKWRDSRKILKKYTYIYTYMKNRYNN